MPRIFVSAVIPAPADKVWGRIRDFNGLPGWLPMVTESRILDDMKPDQVGCTREFVLQDGGKFNETLVSLSDYDMSFSYTMGESPLALTNYMATMRLTPVTETDQTFAEWMAEFDCAAEDEDGLVETVRDGVFETGFRELVRHFGS